MENLTRSFRETNIVRQLIESQIKSKTLMSWNSRKKKEDIFCNVNLICRNEIFLTFVFYLNV